jgi:hypothetical protein
MGETVFDTVDQRPAASSASAPSGGDNWMGLVLAALATASVLACLVGFALGHAGLGVAGACVALLASGAALSLASAESRQVRDSERLLH